MKTETIKMVNAAKQAFSLLKEVGSIKSAVSISGCTMPQLEEIAQEFKTEVRNPLGENFKSHWVVIRIKEFNDSTITFQTDEDF